MRHQSEGVVVSQAELERRTIRREDLVSCNQAFIDCRTPGSEKKENYALIGPGVSQSADQFVNLQEPHGYNIGAAAMPNGVVNNLHLHFTAEVFINFRGDWQVRWGADGTDGEYLSREGDIISVPAWVFRGFTNVGPDDGWLLTALGRDVTGGIIWGPQVIREAAGHGLYLSEDSRLIETTPGEAPPAGVRLIEPMTSEEIGGLRRYTAAEMRGRITSAEDRTWSGRAFLCGVLPGGGAELASVIGYGMTEDRHQGPRVLNPHGFNVAWLRAEPGEGLLSHRHHETQTLLVKEGRWEVVLNIGPDEVRTVVGPRDTFSVPVGAWRSLRNVGEAAGEIVVVNSGDGRVRLEWDGEVVAAARQGGVALDADGYLAPWNLIRNGRETD
ncbi:cupin domain-containing protein [Streptosporangium sp. NBC_01756]|uniref:cupin domain-containing protein n=1 Tax=Streptosporangium sp. NBC_01756 TaxID=2975950 RepID=UPI002DDC6E02|nr:cupin domain-containing protein [Streptosporangium sp. NBC_01756]WSC87959.1 cupin domain-containing protein [Streptosporangium sp. NBC_01756]